MVLETLFKGESNMTATNFQAARKNMVNQQIRCCKILDDTTLDLIKTMPREAFVPEHVRSLAYMEGHVPLSCHQEMLSPLQEAAILQCLNLNGRQRVLEIGTGTGFLTAMLALQSEQVISCELHEELATQATTNLANHGISNASVIQLNGMDPDAVSACPELQQPFDAIVIGAAIPEIPAHLEALLKHDAQLIAFVGSSPAVSLVHKQKSGRNWEETSLFETLLLDMEAIPENREFVF